MDKIKQALQAQVTVIEDNYRHYLNNPFEASHAHALRVSLRTMRALLNFLKKSMDADVYESYNQQLRESAALLGPLRELDVLLDWCAESAVKEDKLTKYYYETFAYLHTLRRREMKKTLNKTSRKQFKQMIAILEAINTDQLKLKDRKDWPRYTKRRLNTKMTQLQDQLTDLNHEDYEGVHTLRKKAKKVRYAASFFGPLTDKNFSKVIHQAKDIQNELGALTDSHVNQQLLIELAAQVDDKAVKSGLLALSKL